jgi:hypothetical protein
MFQDYLRDTGELSSSGTQSVCSLILSAYFIYLLFIIYFIFIFILFLFLFFELSRIELLKFLCLTSKESDTSSEIYSKSVDAKRLSRGRTIVGSTSVGISEIHSVCGVLCCSTVFIA